MPDSRMIPPENNSDDEDELIEMIDEDGNPAVFEHLATLEYNGESYLALSDPESDEEELSVIIMKIALDEDGNDIYVQPEESEEEAVFEAFLQMIDDMEEDGE